MARKKKDVFDQGKEVRKLARERVGQVQPSRPIEPKEKRRKAKHKERIDADSEH